MCLQKRYRALYSYTAADADEVSLQEGDLIADVQQIDEGWMYGRIERTGQQGMLPANYVQPLWNPGPRSIGWNIQNTADRNVSMGCVH